MTFNALRVFQEDGKITSSLVRASLDELTPGEVLIKAAYSSVNYKDALAATGAGKILRRFPLIAGIDVSGTVESSSDPRFPAGVPVLVTGYDLGVNNDGGYAEYVRVPADWVVPIPGGLDVFDVMAIGTAGFTAALSIVELEHHGLKSDAGPVIVTGSTGGVGSLAVDMLSGLGFDVTALTGKDDQHDFLRGLGAKEILSRHGLQMGTRPLERTMWAGAVDAVGGEVLAWLTRTMIYGGAIASSGLTAGTELKTTVLPFILRGVKLLGIDSVACPMPLRLEVWRRLASDLKPKHLRTIAHEVDLAGLPAVFPELLAGNARGRTVVRLR
jgi:NADPH2:quinone reductase